MSKNEKTPFNIENLQNCTGIATRWLLLPSVIDLSDEEKDAFERATTPSEQVKAFIDELDQTITEDMASERQIVLVTEALTRVYSQLSGQDRSVVQSKLFRRRASLQGNIAMNGQNASGKLSAEQSIATYLSAAADFMRADLAVGTITDNALYVGMALDGAGVSGLSMQAYKKVIRNPIIKVQHGTPDDVIVQSMLKQGRTQKLADGITAVKGQDAPNN